MKIYLIGYFDDLHYPSEVLNELELIPEKQLVETVKTMIDEGRISDCTITDGEYNLDNLDTKTAKQILKDDGYTVKSYIIKD